VIKSFRDKTTEAVFNGESPKGFPADLVKVARRKLRYLNAAGELGDLRRLPAIVLRRWRAIARGNTRSGSTTNSGCALFGRRKARRRSR
jgi:plasmid maintenance system killer protein